MTTGPAAFLPSSNRRWAWRVFILFARIRPKVGARGGPSALNSNNVRSRPTRQATGPRGEGGYVECEKFHHLEVFSLCSQSVLSLPSHADWLSTRLDAGFT